jgi:hypothetical protein
LDIVTSMLLSDQITKHTCCIWSVACYATYFFVYGEAALGAGMAASQVDGYSPEHPLYRSARDLARIFNQCGVDERQPMSYCPGDWPTALVQACERAVSVDPTGAQETVAKYRAAYEEICCITRDTPDTASVFGDLITQ